MNENLYQTEFENGDLQSWDYSLTRDGAKLSLDYVDSKFEEFRDELLFIGFVAYRFTGQKFITPQQQKSYMKVTVVKDSVWLAEMLQGWRDRSHIPSGSEIKHFLIHLDDRGAFEFLALDLKVTLAIARKS